MQFQVQAGAPGKKTSGAPNWRRKGQEGRHAVSSASRGSREENVRGAKLTEKRTRGAPCSFKCKQGLQGRKLQGAKLTEDRTRGSPCSFKWKQGLQWKKKKKRQGRQIDGEKDERGACSFKCKQGLQGRKRQGRQIDGEKDERAAIQFQVQAKGQEGRHAVSSASRGSREENVRGAKLTEKKKQREGRHAVSSASMDSREENFRGAKLTEKRTRGVPCSFKYEQGLQGRKRQGRQIDGEKENKSLNCQTYFPFGLKIRNVVFLNSIIMMLVSFTFLLYFTSPRQCHPWSYKGKSSWYRLDKWKKK